MDKNRLLGGNPLGVALRLAVLSVIVGVVLSALGITPGNILDHVRLFANRVWSMGFGAVESLLGYLLVGALVVVPVWLVARLLGGLKRRD